MLDVNELECGPGKSVQPSVVLGTFLGVVALGLLKLWIEHQEQPAGRKAVRR